MKRLQQKGTTQLTQETTQSTGETIQSPGETTQPAGETTQPTEETTQPTEETPHPTEETTQPTEETPQPTEETTQPTEETTQPTEETPQPAEEIEGTNLCKHHTEHDETCGYTEENPVCGFVCEICPVQKQIDDFLLQCELALEQAEELDEEAMMALTQRLYEQGVAAVRAYNSLESEQRLEIENFDTLAMILETFAIQTLDPSTATMEIKTAEIWAEGTANQTLTDSGEFSVDFSKQFTLHIVVESTLNLPNKKVEITVPDGLTVVEYPIPERGGMAESVTPENIEDLNSDNNYGGYCPQNGTITYSLKNTAEKNSFNIVLAPDTALWNRKKEQTLGSKLTVKVYTDGENVQKQEYQTISATAKITGNYDATRAIQTGPRLSKVGVKNGVPTAANQPFALRQIWINPDKDYIDMPQFFKKLEITIALPYYTGSDGSNVYAELDHITWDPAGESTRPNMLDPKNHQDADGSGFAFNQSTNNIDHTVILTWNNLYLEYGQEYFTPYFKWTEKCTNEATNAVKWSNSSILINSGNNGATPTGANGAASGKITWADDSVWYPLSQFTGLTFTAHAGESMTVGGKTQVKEIYNAKDNSITYYLGQFQVVNHGGDASAKKVVEFTYVNNDKIGVTAQKIPATTGNNVSVRYTTTKSESQIPYENALISKGGFVTFTEEMAGLRADEYFTSIIASVGSYEKDCVGYVSSRSDDPTSSYGCTFGKLLTGDTGTYIGFATINMYDDGSDQTNPKKASYNVIVTDKAGEIPPGMEQAYKENSLERVPILSDPETGESKTKATAGDTITFNGLLSSSAYPYSSNNIMTDPVIYIRLPDKITVKNLKLYQEAGRMADKVFLFDAVTETVSDPTRRPIEGTLEEIPAPAATADDATKTVYNLYKIDLRGNKVGWFTDTLGQYQIGISFDMEIAKDAEAMTLDMRDCVRFKSALLRSTSNNGTLAQYQVRDTYDMDGDNDTNEFISTFNVNAAGTKLSVVAARLGLTFTFGAMAAEKDDAVSHDPKDYSNFEEKGNKVYLKDNDHVVDMLFTLKNDTGREFSRDDAQAFYYFIPVPKAGNFWDSHMQDKAFEFDMALTGAAELDGASVGRKHIQVTYSTTVDSSASAGDPHHYSTVADNYVTADKIIDWGEVKMIRVAATEDTESIPMDAELLVNLRLKPAFQSNADLVGSVVNFGPCGVSPYSVGTTQNQGHNPLPRIQVEFQTGVIEGKIFIDKNFDGTYTEGTDVLCQKEVQVEAPHENGIGADDTEGHETTAKGGTFQFTGRRADTYHVIVTNPGSEDLSADTPLKFSLPESNSQFLLGEDSKTATATVALAKGTGKGTATLAIGLQEPHTVTFSASNATLSNASTKVWHNEKLGESNIPKVAESDGWRFTGNWTSGANTYTADQLKDAQITSDTTFTAEVKKLYSVSYDLNGGSGAVAPATTWHIEGEQVKPDYTGTNSLKKGEKTIFVGWSTYTPIEDALKADANQDEISRIITTDEHTMPDHNVTLYAVYAVDDNENGKPDYNDDSVHVRYHGNNNDYTDYICPHHHVVGGKAALSTSGTVNGKKVTHGDPASNAAGEVESKTFTYDTNIFIGWSTTPILDQVIKTKTEYEALKDSIVKEVTMLAKAPETTPPDQASNTSLYADADGNTNVYAVWAANRNGNSVADYREEQQLTYDGNALEGGTVSGLPTDTGVYIPGDKATLSADKPTHSEVNSKKVVFIGWTENRTNSIFSRKDTAPATVTEVTFGEVNKTVYAAWGYDENGDGTADVLETYSLTYDLNGGKGNTPAAQSNIQKDARITLTTEKGFTRNDKEVFVGWSRTKNSAAYTANQKDDVGKILITGTEIIMGTEDITLWAVWATDSNGNGYADYSESSRLNYDGNALEGNVLGTPTDLKYYVPDDKVTLTDTPAPTHTKVNEKTVLFLGWTEAKTDRIFNRADDAPVRVTEVTFGNSDITVYAAWGYDEDDDNTADVLETYSLSYDLNGGTGNIPTGKQGVPKNTEIPLTTEKNFQRDVGEVFVGWSRTKREAPFKAGQETEANATMLAEGKVTMGTEDIILYALWAEDSNGDGIPDYSTDCTVTYDLGGGTPAPGVSYGPEQVRMGTNILVKAAPIRRDYRFTGWTTERARAVYQPGDTLTVNSDLTLTAQWEEAPTEPSKPSESTEPDDSDKSPRTGDETRLGLWLTLAGIFGVGMIAIPVISRRRRKDKRGDR